MKTRSGKMNVRALALAVEGVLFAMYAMPVHADDAGAAALKLPTNFFELGGTYVPRDSAKFGEYSGLNKSGGYAIGNFSVRGGDAYGDGNGTTRWALTGSDIGLTTRAFGATIGDQGRWNLGIGYDQLRHNLSDSYNTPYVGSMGGNSFTLPAGFGPVADTRSMSAAQKAAFHPEDISSTRENGSFTAGINLNRQWDIKFDFNELQQSGARLMGSGSSTFGGAAGERISILPMPRDNKTSTANLALNWLGDKGHATASYFGSFFRDNFNGVTFSTWSTALQPVQTMGTEPSNDFHQLNLNGGYAFSARTKLAGGLSYGRSTQNTPFAYDAGAVVAGLTPFATSSANALVVTEHVNLKLTDQTTKNLALSGGIKYDLRDNRTASNIYNFRAIDGANIANYPNTPLSNWKGQLELAGDYRLDPKQKIRLAFNHEQVRRWCNQYAAGGGTPAYAPGTNCVVATGNKEDKVSATYRRKTNDTVNWDVGYTYSNRRSTFDQYARTAMIGTDGNVIVPGAAITGINGADFRGFQPFFEASRKQQMLKSGITWEVNDRWSVVAGGRFMKETYGPEFGVHDGTAWAMNLDTTYNYREKGSITAYVTRQDRRRYQTNEQRSPTTAATVSTATALGVPSGATWNDKLTDQDTTLGLTFKQGGLMADKLELVGDFIYSLGKTGYDTTFNYNSTTTVAGGSLGCNTAAFLTCATTPDIRNSMFQLKLTGTYDLNKRAKINVGYLFRRLRSDDYYYNGLQTGYTPTSVLPTNEMAPNYAVNLVWASYIYTFK